MGKCTTVIKVAPLVKHLYPVVTDLFYWRDNETKEEYVQVVTNSNTYGVFDVCVTCDSDIAVVKDLFTALNRRLS